MTDQPPELAPVIPLRIPEQQPPEGDPRLVGIERRAGLVEVAASMYGDCELTHPLERQVVELLNRAADLARQAANATAKQQASPAPFRTRPPRPPKTQR